MKALPIEVWKAACLVAERAINVGDAYDGRAVFLFPGDLRFCVAPKKAGVHDLAHAYLSIDIAEKFKAFSIDSERNSI